MPSPTFGSAILKLVSIHAPRFREAMLPAAQVRQYTITEFQSTPPVSGRRCAGRAHHVVVEGNRFNPRPPFPGGDAPAATPRRNLHRVSIHAPRFREAMHGLGCRHSCRQCFNPRPPFPGGDARRQRRAQRQHRVSIHAPRFREAMRRCFPVSLARCNCFNPRPPFPGGDATGIPFIDDVCVVSIHAPRFREAMLHQARLVQHLMRFQSTPPVSGRRCLRDKQCPACGSKFQSTPPVSGRRCVKALGAGGVPLGRFNPRPPFPGGDAEDPQGRTERRAVSIHAPRFREAMPHGGSTSRQLRCCFNPRPPFPGGDAQVLRPGIQHASVSIHAPRFREAMLLLRENQDECGTFQSTPPVSGRRCPATRCSISTRCSFNPRPPFPGGDAHCHAGAGQHRAVSIHAPRFREAMPRWPTCCAGWRMFQSTPPVSGRRCTLPNPSSASISLFQSTPPVSGRRCLPKAKTQTADGKFQSTPPVSGRRCRRGSGCVSGPARFNPRPPFPGGDARRRRLLPGDSPVSIHAPRFREAMPGHLPRPGNRPALRFNPRPPFPGGDARAAQRRPGRGCCFNPRPPFPGGDAASASRSAACLRCFNPRPPFPGGDARSVARNRVVVFVSIHAPRFREAMRNPNRRQSPTRRFQSTPPVSGRRCRRDVPVSR